MTPEEFAIRATDILFGSLSKLPLEEQDRRLDAFERAVNLCINVRRKRCPNCSKHHSREEGFYCTGCATSLSKLIGEDVDNRLARMLKAATADYIPKARRKARAK
jgi:hypothetical protein